MKKLALLLVIAMLAGVMLPACGKTETTTDPGTTTTTPGTTTTEPTKTEKRDTINMCLNMKVTSVDGQGAANLQDLIYRYQMYEGLVFLNESTGTIEPRIADSWETSEDGLTMTFKLHPGVKFQNGDELKPSDVIFSLLRAKDQPAVAPKATWIKDVTSPDDSTVVITLEKPNVATLVNLSALFIMSEREIKEQGDKFGTIVTTCGTGPYKMTGLDFTSFVKFEAFPDYYRGEAPIKYLNFKVIVEASAGLISFEAGELDFYIAPIANWADLTANTNYKTEVVTANHLTYTAINYAANDVLANDKVREAIAYAHDKEAMNIAGFDGNATIADYLEYPKFNIGAPSENVLVYKYDPEYAKKCLEEAGYANGCDVGQLMCFPGSHFEKCAEVLNANCTSVGITNVLTLLEQATSLVNYRAQEYDFAVTGGSSSGDYDNLRFRFYSSAKGSYFVDYTKNNKFDYKWMDETIDKSVATQDPTERLKIDAELSDYIAKTFTLIPILHKVSPYVFNKDLNVVSAPTNYQVYNWSWN